MENWGDTHIRSFYTTKGDSAVNQLINITNDFGKALDSGKEVRVVFCDISKAFDRLGLSTMRYKLVSSANSLISALISFTISFIKIKYKRAGMIILITLLKKLITD
jgi:hypothetical protein